MTPISRAVRTASTRAPTFDKGSVSRGLDDAAAGHCYSARRICCIAPKRRGKLDVKGQFLP